MSYEIGTHIDLTYLNDKVSKEGPKKFFQEATGHLIEVGTSFSFKEGKAAKKIQVIFA